MAGKHTDNLPGRMFGKVLVANRGEIAIRVMRSLEELGVASVAVYSEPDRDAPHARRADEAYLLGPGPAAESYLNVERILDAARKSGAEAIHPGYGFLAENAAFARACEEAGIVFVGPPADAIDAMGSKTKARELMKAAGVPIVPGTTDPVATVEDARKVIADSIGYPVAIKAAGGGGGKGFRVAETEDKLEEAFEGASREGEKFFSDATVYVERYLPDPRHVEVQVLADSQGNVIHLFERDCSVQRRHQKLIEESPAPAVDPELRERIGKIGTEAARAVGYRSAGTIEGLLADGEYFFLEMNTRVQVEHCVTEMVTGIDIVREQLKIAAGRAAGLHAGRRGDPRPRHRVPHQRRGRLQEVRARTRADHLLPRAQRPVRARGLRGRGGLRGAPPLRPDDRQADRVGRGPRGLHPADAARAGRVRDRRSQDADPLPPGADEERAVGARRDLPRPRGGPGVAEAAGLPRAREGRRRRRGGREGVARVRRGGVGPPLRRDRDRRGRSQRRERRRRRGRPPGAPARAQGRRWRRSRRSRSSRPCRAPC